MKAISKYFFDELPDGELLHEKNRPVAVNAYRKLQEQVSQSLRTIPEQAVIK